MSGVREPYISADESPMELTLRVVLVGIVLGVLMTAANAYLGLYAGMTVSASIPAAVMSMIILRSLFKDVSILENNAVQTMASAGESLAAGVIFTVPALLVMNLWTSIQWMETLIIATLGGLLGTMFTIALRRLFIVEEALPYPEGVACREVLVAGEEGGDGALAILYALAIGGIYGLMVKGFEVTHHTVEGAVSFVSTRLYAGMDLSIALLSVGYIVGIRIASFIFFGGVLGFGLLVPMYGLIYGWPATDSLVDGFYAIWSTQVRYVGVGAMVVGGIYTLWSMRKPSSPGCQRPSSKTKQIVMPSRGRSKTSPWTVSSWCAASLSSLPFSSTGGQQNRWFWPWRVRFSWPLLPSFSLPSQVTSLAWWVPPIHPFQG